VAALALSLVVSFILLKRNQQTTTAMRDRNSSVERGRRPWLVSVPIRSRRAENCQSCRCEPLARRALPCRRGASPAQPFAVRLRRPQGGPALMSPAGTHEAVPMGVHSRPGPTAEVSKIMGKPNPTHSLPLAKAPFRFRATRLNGVIRPKYPDLPDPSVRAYGSYDDLSETLGNSLPGWTVIRSNDGFGFDLLHPTWMVDSQTTNSALSATVS
jgi:hypothetical protein